MEKYGKLFTNEKKYKRKKFCTRGKFDTEAQILAISFAMRSCWRPLQVTKFFSLIFTYRRLKIL